MSLCKRAIVGSDPEFLDSSGTLDCFSHVDHGAVMTDMHNILIIRCSPRQSELPNDQDIPSLT